MSSRLLRLPSCAQPPQVPGGPPLYRSFPGVYPMARYNAWRHMGHRPMILGCPVSANRYGFMIRCPIIDIPTQGAAGARRLRHKDVYGHGAGCPTRPREHGLLTLRTVERVGCGLFRTSHVSACRFAWLRSCLSSASLWFRIPFPQGFPCASAIKNGASLRDGLRSGCSDRS